MLGLEDSIIFAASLDVGILTLKPIKENTQNRRLFCHDMKQTINTNSDFKSCQLPAISSVVLARLPDHVGHGLD